MSLRSPIGRVLGLGAAKEGVSHWWSQRVTSVALVLLCLWFVASLLRVQMSDYDQVVTWIAQPLNTVLLLLLIATLVYHSLLGVQVVVEDYVYNDTSIEPAQGDEFFLDGFDQVVTARLNQLEADVAAGWSDFRGFLR